MKKILFFSFVLLGFACSVCHAQPVDSAGGKVLSFPGRLLGRIRKKTADLNARLTQQSEKYLQKMARQESKVQLKLYGIDSAAAKTLFAGSSQQYAALIQRLRTDTGSRGRSFSGAYLPYLDSLQGSVKFLQQNPQLLSTGGVSPSVQAQQQQLDGAGGQLQALEARMQVADQAKAFMQQRKQQIAQYISQHADLHGVLGNATAGMNKTVYYYGQQLREYKEMWANPDQLEQKALTALNRVPGFQTFMKENSMLGGLFHLPGNYGAPQAISGLQTKDQVAAQVAGQMPSVNSVGGDGGGGTGSDGGAGALEGKLQSAESQLNTYKNKLTQLGGGSGDMDLPDFKPNDQKTKTFWRRLQYGTDFQTTRNNYYFPLVTDFGLSLGYKMGHSNIIGVGVSYKLGWGNGIQHIAFTSEGVGIRSFLQIKVKGTFSATGGFEYNYATPFSSFQDLKRLQYWTKSGLIGVMKTVSVKSRVFKKTSVSLLWDFLSYQQVPQTQPFVFRIGYVF